MKKQEKCKSNSYTWGIQTHSLRFNTHITAMRSSTEKVATEQPKFILKTANMAKIYNNT